MAAPTATPTPTPTPTHIESPAAAAAAPPRKLPIKRKNIPLPQEPQHDPLLAPDPLAKPSSSDPGFDEDDDFDEGDDDGCGAAPADARSAAAAAPPFRFQRVWSESDEIRFLQGLLGCWSQGLVFPRDLNLFFDRFSESMPQPYTRSQLSEKLRRLRKKFRVMSARIARGQDPARLAPHDRDVLHLCTRLWHPSYAASSPFSVPDALAPGSGGNKRRRPNPRAPSGQARLEDLAPPPPPPPQPLATLPPPPAVLPPPSDEKDVTLNSAHIGGVEKEQKQVKDEVKEEEKEAEPVPGIAGDETAAAGMDVVPRHLLAKTILDVFDACLQELKMTSSGAMEGSDLAKRWREQRVAEMDVLARRFRLVLENAIKN